ncbi:uncharacterized protein LOC143362498 isoform X2 [Halictus rubicundus]|uniref:uncharacterized protein LOC143362498 isoform X2 n=1 Tax=Halictus rubicundus TaxID=77578 RepID=UPI00403512A1
MFSLNNTNVYIIILILCVLLQTVETTQFLMKNDNRRNVSCSLPLTTLDFIYNFTKPNLENVWPCEVRFYWLSLQPFVNIVRFLLGYITPLIIILGVLLNTISFVMLSTPILCESNLSLYLKALALSDNGALIFNYAVGIAKSHFPFVNNLFMNSRFLCSLNSITMEFFQFTSTWLVVALTWTRVFAIIFPFGIPGHCNNCSEMITIITLICTSFVISLTKLYSGGYETDSVFEFIPCQKKIKPWGSAMYFYIALSTWLPLMFIFLGNILLIVHMRKTERIHCQLTLLLLPLGIVETLELYWDVILIKEPASEPKKKAEYIHWLKEKMLLKWCRGLCFHVYHWNFAINFFLYYLTGEKFRNVVIQKTRHYKHVIFSVFTRHIDKCVSCSKYPMHTKSMQCSNVFLIRAITLSEHSINDSISIQNNGSTVTDI